jgi:DNA polymerase-3 subunit gamma/tau
LSRCQRYDFSKITKNDIKKRLEFIASEEQIEADPKAIDYIIKNSDG